MGYAIGIADLAANALIEALKIDETRVFLTYDEIEAYGCEVVNVLRERGQEATLILSRDYTERFLHDYSDFFVADSNEQHRQGLRLAEGKDKSDLIERFRGYIALDVLRAFVNSKSVDTLRTHYA